MFIFLSVSLLDACSCICLFLIIQILSSPFHFISFFIYLFFASLPPFLPISHVACLFFHSLFFFFSLLHHPSETYFLISVSSVLSFAELQFPVFSTFFPCPSPSFIYLSLSRLFHSFPCFSLSRLIHSFFSLLFSFPAYPLFLFISHLPSFICPSLSRLFHSFYPLPFSFPVFSTFPPFPFSSNPPNFLHSSIPPSPHTWIKRATYLTASAWDSKA